jgi:hypothetical protein
MSDALVTSLISTVDPSKTGTVIIGNDVSSKQVYNSDTINEASNQAENRNIPVVDTSGCIEKLKTHYGFANILIIKSDSKMPDKNNTVVTSVQLDYLNPNTREMLDKSICSDQSTVIKMPLPPMNEMQQKVVSTLKGEIDVFNPNDTAFRSKCYSHVDNSTDYDTTLNYRIDNYFQQQTMCSFMGCEYNQTQGGYYSCICQGVDKEFADKPEATTIAHSSNVNLGIMSCGGKALNRKSLADNPSVPIYSSLFGVQIILILLLTLLHRRDMNLKEIIRQDCLIYNKETITLDEYFHKIPPKPIDRRNDFDINSTRSLKDEALPPAKPNNEILQLNDNINNLESLDLHKFDNLNDPEFVNNKPKVNNYVDKTIDEGGDNNVVITNEHPEVIKIYKGYSIKDYDTLNMKDLLKYENRSCFTIFWDNLILRHILFSIIFRHSLLEPVHIRASKLVFELFITLGFNAFLFTDNYIEFRALAPNRVRHIP